MIQAKSEVDFDGFYVAGKNLLENQPHVNGQLLSILTSLSAPESNLLNSASLRYLVTMVEIERVVASQNQIIQVF